MRGFAAYVLILAVLTTTAIGVECRSGTETSEQPSGCHKLIKRPVVVLRGVGLKENWAVPNQLVCTKRLADGVDATTGSSGWVDVVDAEPPVAVMAPPIEEARESCDQRARMERPGRRGRKAPSIGYGVSVFW
jgi:hypothetical protein